MADKSEYEIALKNLVTIIREKVGPDSLDTNNPEDVVAIGDIEKELQAAEELTNKTECDSCEDMEDHDNIIKADGENLCEFCHGRKYQHPDATLESFIECFFEGDKTAAARAVEDDSVMWCENWNNYTDGLCKDGKISNEQYHEMSALDDLI